MRLAFLFSVCISTGIVAWICILFQCLQCISQGQEITFWFFPHLLATTLFSLGLCGLITSLME